MQKNIIYYNENEVIDEVNGIGDIKKGYKIWIDIVSPTSTEIAKLKQLFNLESKGVEKVEKQIKKPQVILFKNQKFSIFLSLKFATIKNLETFSVYFFVGDGWLITIHSEDVDLLVKGRILLSEGEKIVASSIDGLYYSFLSSIVQTYEQILTAMELEVIEIEKRAQHHPSKKVLKNIDLISKQVISLRRHFWQARHVINYHNYMEEDQDDIKYLKIVYDDINQLIEMAESYQDTINSTRETFSSSISMQTNDVMKILTIFSTIVLPLSLLTSILSLQGLDLNNFTTLPKYIYYLTLIMIIIVGVTLGIFWKKQWIFKKDL
ncbi:MAG TPA: CorA family divalent cation transporter [Verrucomicrobiae bacterium]|nr:CorA family divalent cation transporter [Verrucomicrobiae bacterium]